jgi:hypothetical protein
MLRSAPVSLATFNIKDFEDFAEHDGLHLVFRYQRAAQGVVPYSREMAGHHSS